MLASDWLVRRPIISLALWCDRVPASFVTQQLLGSYAVQSDIGNYDIDEHGAGIEYIKDMQFVPPIDQTDDLLEKIARLHALNRSVMLVSIAVFLNRGSAEPKGSASGIQWFCGTTGAQ